MTNLNTLANVKNSVWSPLNIDGCVAYWPFDEQLSYLNTKDIVGGYDLTVSNNPVPELDRNGKIGARRLFSIGNSNAAGFIRSGTIGTVPAVAQGQSFSFSFWMYFEPEINNKGTNSTAFLMNFSNTVDGNGQIRLGSGSPSTGWTNFSSRLYYTDSTFTTVWIGNNNTPTNLLSILPQNQWSHWAWIYDASLHEIRVYLNGTLINTVAATSEKISSGIGGGLRIPANNFQVPGLLDDMALFNKAISQEEISLLASTNNPIFGASQITSIPSQVSGCVFWLDASDPASVVIESGVVSQWNDKSGNGFNAFQASLINRPSYVSGVQNGLNAVYCGAANSGNLNTDITGQMAQTNQSYTLFVAAKKTEVDLNTSALSTVLLGQRSTGCFAASIYIGPAGAATSQIRFYSSGPDLAVRTISNPTSDPFIVTLSKIGSNVYNTRSLGATGFDNYTMNNSTGRSILNNIGSSCSGVNTFGGYIYEIMMFNYEMNLEEKIKWEKYLSDKWGIGLYKPLSGHPDVQNWIDRVYANNGTLSQDTVDHVTNFCYEIDNAGLRNKFIRLNLFCGNDIEACATPLYIGPNLKNGFGFNSDVLSYTGSNLPFKNSDYIERGANAGLTGRYNSTTNNNQGPGLRTGIAVGKINEFLSENTYIRSAGRYKLYNTMHLGFFCNNFIAQRSSGRLMGLYSAVAGEARYGCGIGIDRTLGSFNVGPFSASNGFFNDYLKKGLYIHNTIGTNFDGTVSLSTKWVELDLFAGKDLLNRYSLSLGPFPNPNTDIEIFAENRATSTSSSPVLGGSLFRSVQTLQYYSIGLGLNEYEVAQFYNILNKFQNKLGRGLPDDTVPIIDYESELVTEPSVTVKGDGQTFTIFRDSTTAISLVDVANVVGGQDYRIVWFVSVNRGAASSGADMRQAGSAITDSPSIGPTTGWGNAIFTARSTGTISIVPVTAGIDFDLDYVSIRRIVRSDINPTISSSLDSITHPDARDWLSRVYANNGSVSLSTATAVQNFCNSIDSAGLRDKFVRLNLFCGNNLRSCLVPLYRGPSINNPYGYKVDLNFIDNFLENDYAENSGLQGDGISKGLSTGVLSYDLGLDFHLSTYVIVPELVNNNAMDIGAKNTNTSTDHIQLGNVLFTGNPSYVFWGYKNSNTPYTRTTTPSYTEGFYLGSCLTNTAKLYKNNTIASSSTNSGDTRTLNGNPVTIFSTSDAMTDKLRNFSASKLGAYSCGFFMDDTQATNFYNIMQTFQTSLNRNI